MSAVARVALAARVFALAAVLSVAALVGTGVVRGAIVVVLVGVWAQVFAATGRIPQAWLAVLEGAVTGVLAAAMWPDNDAVTPYLLVPALVGGLTAGILGVVRVLAVESIVTAAAWTLLVHQVDRATLASVLVWFITGLGLGILGVAFRRTLSSAGTDSSYRDALQLIKQLHALSGRLTDGLDAVALSEQIIERASRHLMIVQAVVLVRSKSGLLTPIRFSDGAATESLLTDLEWSGRVWESGSSETRGQRTAIPLRADDETVGLLVSDSLSAPDATAVDAAAHELAADAVQLHAALLFGDVRDAATSEERQRLAREVHDGVAQDVASLGYLVDNLADTAITEEQVQLFAQLRQEVTRVVGELRHSVFDLRNEVGAGQGLGQSISSFARHVGSHSDLTVHVTLDEGSGRIRPDIEAELLRITQEAINNARKHSGGRNLWVHCSVQPPVAAIEVRDDGEGLGVAREDSHGLRIMRERAERIGAVLDVTATAGGGTCVSVRLGTRVTSLLQG